MATKLTPAQAAIVAKLGEDSAARALALNVKDGEGATAIAAYFGVAYSEGAALLNAGRKLAEAKPALDDEKVKLIEVHAEHRRDSIVAAFKALVAVHGDDFPFVLDAVRAGAIDEAKLGRRIAEYREALGKAYASH